MEHQSKITILVTTSALLLALPIFFAVCAFCLPARYEDTFLGELKEKCRRLETTEGKRIILVGGSGIAFGYDSAMLEEAFPEYRAVNFGMYAGLGTKVMLDLSEDGMREGDIVILSPEQEAQTLSDYFNGEAMWQAADGDFSLLLKIKPDNWGQMLGALPGFAADKLRYHLKNERPNPGGVYQKSVFNTYGDIDTALCGKNSMPNGHDLNTPVRFTQEIWQEEFLEYMNAYARRLKKQGIKVWYRFCPVNALAAGQEEVNTYYETLQEKLDFPVIGNPNDSLMDAEWFYDTNFHLNSSGRTVNTIQCIRDIKAMLGDSARVAYDLPQKPELHGDAGEKDAPAEDGLEEPQILYAEVYAGNEDIRTVTVPEEITLIEDGAFEGCTHLQAIILENVHPSEIRPGQELLRGTDADVYVKDEVLSEYRLNYFWSVYAGRIHGQSALDRRKESACPGRFSFCGL